LQLDFYTQFMKVHVKCKVGLQAFEKLKPYYVKRHEECNTCTCKYHSKMVELQHGFNNMWIASKGVHGRICNYNCDICCSEIPRHCIAKQVQFSRLIDMWTLNLFPMEDSAWHSPCCLKGECLNCGVNMFMTCLTEENKHLAICM
jgi:hypothetical protein